MVKDSPDKVPSGSWDKAGTETAIVALCSPKCPCAELIFQPPALLALRHLCKVQIQYGALMAHQWR